MWCQPGRCQGDDGLVARPHFHVVVFSPHLVQCTSVNLPPLTGTGARRRATAEVQPTAVEAALLPLLAQVRLYPCTQAIFNERPGYGANETYSRTCCLVVRCYVSPTVCRVSGQVQVSQFNIDYRYTPFYFSQVKSFSINSNGIQS